MRNRKGYCLSYGRMLEEDLIDLARSNLFPAAVDDLLDTAREEQVAIGVQIPGITRPEPTMCECTAVGRWVVLVARHDGCASHHNLADCTGWQHGACVIYDGNFHAYCYAYRTGLPLT